MSKCPCGSGKTYAKCCGLFIDNHKAPETPEQLMRSRYTAYTLAQTNYISKTMREKALVGFDEFQSKQWAQKVIWIGLTVKQSTMETPDKGYVEFIAHWIEKNHFCTMHERSEFHRMNNQWFYVDGVNLMTSLKKNQIKIGRNSPCPCGSGKKFKNCHEQ